MSGTNTPPATPDLVDLVMLSLNNTRECSTSKGFLTGYIIEEFPQTGKLLSTPFFDWLKDLKCLILMQML